MGRYRKIWAVAISVMFFVIGGSLASFAEEKDGPKEPELYAQSAVLMDAKTGRVLWEKNGDTIRPMASTTKIMTCILALEMGLGDDRLTKVSQLAASQPQVHLGMRAGQKFYTKDLLYSLMLESHNDAAVAIAEAAAGSVSEFAKLMNQKAKMIGCEDTWFITPNGLDGKVTDQDGTEHIHSTTAKDLAWILSYCILQSPKAEAFLTITQTSDYHFQDGEGKGNYCCHNHNNLFHLMEGVLSGKTGFTGGAGYCYTGAVEDDGRIFAIALLGCGWPPHKTYKWSDAKTLINYGKEHYQYRDIYRQITLDPLPVENGIYPDGGTSAPQTRLQVQGAKSGLPILISSQDKVKLVKKLPAALKAPIKSGEQVGAIEYYLNDQKIAAYPILAQDEIEAFSFQWCMKAVTALFLGGKTFP